MSEQASEPYQQSRQSSIKPAFIPPPYQIALLGTVVVHPAYTSRAQERPNAHVSARALTYLRGLLGLVGPLNANFRRAFVFHQDGNRNAVGRRGRSALGGFYGSDSQEDDSARSSDSDDLESNKLANEQSLWNRAADFWAILGWAFRCASEHPDRWRYWRVWLEFMLDVLEADWDERLEADKAAHEEIVKKIKEEEDVAVKQEDKEDENPVIAVVVEEVKPKRRLPFKKSERDDTGTVNGRQNKKTKPEEVKLEVPRARESLFASYLFALQGERKNSYKEVSRALLAFADDDNLTSDRSTFKEVFKNETVTGPAKQGKRKRAETVTLDLENDQFGDYLDGDDDDMFDDEQPADRDAIGDIIVFQPSTSGRALRRGRGRRQKTAVVVANTSPSASYIRSSEAMAETVTIRMRLFRLLSNATNYAPDLLLPVYEFYEKFTDSLRELPLPVFRLFAEPHRTPDLPNYIRVSLLRYLIEPLLPSNAPKPSMVDRKTDDAHGVSALMLEQCFLPFPANRVSVDENARLSIALECMAWHLYEQGKIHYSAGLRRAVEKGIKAREDKCKSRTRGGGENAENKAAREMLSRSARSLRVWIDVVEVTPVEEIKDGEEEDAGKDE